MEKVYMQEIWDMVKKIFPTRLCEYKEALGIVRFHSLGCGMLHQKKIM